jgi:3',5'-cyclic AMP phosphodiesterase CpdA
MKKYIRRNIKIVTFLTVIIVSSPLISSDNLITTDYEEKNLIQTPSILIGPFSQDSDMNSITILWETDVKTSRNEVHWGSTPDCENISSESYEKNFFGKNLHKVLLNGLTPSTRYYYKVVSDRIESEVYTFHTSYAQNETIKFVVYGDNRGVWDNWQNATLVARSIEEKTPDFVLSSGDLVLNGKNRSQWIDFFSISSFIHNSTLYPILGNHELYGSSYFKYFILPNNERWYSFDNGPVHFIGLDSNPRNAFRLSQMIWLIRNLRANAKPFTIVYFHHPMYSSGAHGSTLYVRFLWRHIFEYYGVDIVFNGHDHSYERGKVNNVNYIVTGGGGAPLYNVGSSWWTIFSEKTYHYCFITANQSLLTLRAIKPDGVIIDSFTIQK